jgi:hypothetical protein
MIIGNLNPLMKGSVNIRKIYSVNRKFFQLLPLINIKNHPNFHKYSKRKTHNNKEYLHTKYNKIPTKY